MQRIVYLFLILVISSQMIFSVQIPSSIPSTVPTIPPTMSPSTKPSIKPSIVPSICPSNSPSNIPTVIPSCPPTIHPSTLPTISPTIKPSVMPTIVPSCQPTVEPSAGPTTVPSFAPSSTPSFGPTTEPSFSPTSVPSSEPSSAPSSYPAIVSAGPTVSPVHGNKTKSSSNATAQSGSFDYSLAIALPLAFAFMFMLSLAWFARNSSVYTEKNPELNDAAAASAVVATGDVGVNIGDLYAGTGASNSYSNDMISPCRVCKAAIRSNQTHMLISNDVKIHTNCACCNTCKSAMTESNYRTFIKTNRGDSVILTCEKCESNPPNSNTATTTTGAIAEIDTTVSSISCKVCHQSINATDEKVQIKESWTHKHCACCAECKDQMNAANFKSFTKHETDKFIVLLCKDHMINPAIAVRQVANANSLYKSIGASKAAKMKLSISEILKQSREAFQMALSLSISSRSVSVSSQVSSLIVSNGTNSNNINSNICRVCAEYVPENETKVLIKGMSLHQKCACCAECKQVMNPENMKTFTSHKTDKFIVVLCMNHVTDGTIANKHVSISEEKFKSISIDKSGASAIGFGIPTVIRTAPSTTPSTTTTNDSICKACNISFIESETKVQIKNSWVHEKCACCAECQLHMKADNFKEFTSYETDKFLVVLCRPHVKDVSIAERHVIKITQLFENPPVISTATNNNSNNTTSANTTTTATTTATAMSDSPYTVPAGGFDSPPESSILDQATDSLKDFDLALITTNGDITAPAVSSILSESTTADNPTSGQQPTRLSVERSSAQRISLKNSGAPAVVPPEQEPRPSADERASAKRRVSDSQMGANNTAISGIGSGGSILRLSARKSTGSAVEAGSEGGSSSNNISLQIPDEAPNSSSNKNEDGSSITSIKSIEELLDEDDDGNSQGSAPFSPPALDPPNSPPPPFEAQVRPKVDPDEDLSGSDASDEEGTKKVKKKKKGGKKKSGKKKTKISQADIDQSFDS